MQSILETQPIHPLAVFHLHNDFFVLQKTKGKVGIIGNFGIGAPVAAIMVEELAAFGVKKFISIGKAGTLQKNLEIGDIVVCEKAVRDEGTSHHYMKPSRFSYASKRLTKKVQETLKQEKVQYQNGTSWTIDAPYRETLKEARQYQKEGVATVEMEAAALFAVAQYRKLEMASLFTISDSLAELKWKPHFENPKTRQGLETLFQVALKTLQ